MSYLIVNVARQRFAVTPAEPVCHCLDGRPLRPGTYASLVKEVVSTQPVNQPRVRSAYHAVLWPMDQHAPLYEARPHYFGPFSSRAHAEAFVLDVSSVVEPVEALRLGVRTRASGVLLPLSHGG